MTEKINGQQNYEKQTTDKERKLVYLRRRLALGGAALVAAGLALGAGHALHEWNDRSDKQLEIEQQPSLEDQIFDAYENYDANAPQIQYEIAADSNISQQAEAAAAILHESDESLAYADNHQAVALTAAKMTARDIEALTGRGVQAGDLVTTWYDPEIGFTTMATEALPTKD